MGLVGGVFGVLLGWGIGRVIQLGTMVYMKRQGLTSPNIWSVPWWLVLGAIGFAVLVSLVLGSIQPHEPRGLILLRRCGMNDVSRDS